MLKVSLTSVLAFVALGIPCALCQTVNFNNSVLSEPPDRKVYLADGVTPIRGSTTTSPATYVAQLYYGAQGAAESSLTPVTAAAARFRPAETGPGLWLGGNRTLTGFGLGFTVTLQVRAWDAGGIGLSYDAARALGYLWGDSATFTYKIPSGFNPGDDYMENFRSFSLVPEASTITLAAVGALGLLLWIRQRQ